MFGYFSFCCLGNYHWIACLSHLISSFISLHHRILHLAFEKIPDLMNISVMFIGCFLYMTLFSLYMYICIIMQPCSPSLRQLCLISPVDVAVCCGFLFLCLFLEYFLFFEILHTYTMQLDHIHLDFSFLVSPNTHLAYTLPHSCQLVFFFINYRVQSVPPTGMLTGLILYRLPHLWWEWVQCPYYVEKVEFHHSALSLFGYPTSRLSVWFLFWRGSISTSLLNFSSVFKCFFPL